MYATIRRYEGVDQTRATELTAKVNETPYNDFVIDGGGNSDNKCGTLISCGNSKNDR
jgi:hypothetical protein